jgi:hypothetical protein
MFGYTFYEYESLPSWWVDEIMIILNQEAEKEKSEAMKKGNSRFPRK